MSATATLDTPVDKGRAYSFGNLIRRGTIDLGTYATNGVAVTKSTFDLPVSLDNLIVQPSGGYAPAWDAANGKLLVYWVDTSTDGAPLAEITDNTDLGAIDFRFEAAGR